MNEWMNEWRITSNNYNSQLTESTSHRWWLEKFGERRWMSREGRNQVGYLFIYLFKASCGGWWKKHWFMFFSALKQNNWDNNKLVDAFSTLIILSNCFPAQYQVPATPDHNTDDPCISLADNLNYLHRHWEVLSKKRGKNNQQNWDDVTLFSWNAAPLSVSLRLCDLGGNEFHISFLSTTVFCVKLRLDELLKCT